MTYLFLFLVAQSSQPASMPASMPADPLYRIAMGTAIPSLELGPVRVRPYGVLDLDFRKFVSPIEGRDGFTLGRARLGLSFGVSTWLGGLIVAEWAKDRPSLLDGYIVLWPLRWLEITLGYRKTPLFISARDEFISQLPIPERGIMVRSFWPGRDLGAELHLLPVLAPIEAFLRLGNGSQNPLGNDNWSFAGEARVDLVLGRAKPFAARDIFFGLRIGVGGRLEDAAEREGIEGPGFGDFKFYRAPLISGGRGLVEGHMRLFLGPITWFVEGAFARESRTATYNINSYGIATELWWMIAGANRGSAEYAVPPGVPRAVFGALELALRAERTGYGLAAPDVTPGGAFAGAGALRWWIFHNFSVAAAYYIARYDAGAMEEPTRLLSHTGILRASLIVR